VSGHDKPGGPTPEVEAASTSLPGDGTNDLPPNTSSDERAKVALSGLNEASIVDALADSLHRSMETADPSTDPADWDYFAMPDEQKEYYRGLITDLLTEFRLVMAYYAAVG
jgi:hypothetical protein